jgi:hypothetical protein
LDYIESVVGISIKNIRLGIITLGNISTPTSLFTIKEIQDEIFLYPNPAANYIQTNIEMNLDEIRIFNSLGQLQKCKITQNKIDVSNLINGTYFLVSSAKETPISRMFVKQ